MKDPTKMTRQEFAEWCYGGDGGAWRPTPDGIDIALAARDKALLLRAAASAHAEVVRQGYSGIHAPALRNAILGVPALVTGMLVRWKENEAVYPYCASMRDGWEPVRIEPLPGGYGRVVED